MNTNLQDPNYHFTRISNKWNEAVQSILDTAAYVSEARKDLNSYQFQQLWERPDAPFSLKTADKLDAIAQNNLLPTIQDKLPPYWTTIYYIASQDDGDVQRAIDAQVINSECSQKEIEQFLKGATASQSQKNSSSTAYLFGKLKVPENFSEEDEKSFKWIWTKFSRNTK